MVRSTNELIGQRIKFDIINKRGVLLVPANTVLTAEDIRKIVNHKVDIFEIELFNGQLDNRRAERLISDITNQSKEIFQSIRYTGNIPLLDIRNNIVPGIHEAAGHTNLFKLFDSLKSKDDYTYRHNIGVGIVSTLIGKWMNLNEQDLSLLSIAAILHDVGKMKIPDIILNKQDEFTEEELSILKSHVIHGYEMLKNTVGTSHRLALITLQHHEREDGSGYPFGLKSEKIDLFAKIIAIANVFHSLSSDRTCRKAYSTFKVIQMIQQEILSGKLNAKIGFLFLHKMMDSMVGNEAILSDERRCKIVRINPYEPMNPLVHINDEFIDLVSDHSIHLLDVIG